MWLGYIALFEHFNVKGPVQASAERTISQNDHGHIVYLTSQENYQLLILQGSAIGLFLAAAVAAYFHKKEAGRRA